MNQVAPLPSPPVGCFATSSVGIDCNSRRFQSRAIWFAALLLATLSSFGGGTVYEPTEAALRAALADNGMVTFACDGRIRLSSALTITADTSIDGTSHQVILSGSGSNRVFEVSTNVHLLLRSVVVADGSAHYGAGILNLGGRVTLDHVGFERNSAGRDLAFTDLVVAEGGAILNRGGYVAATKCTFTSNVVAQAVDPYVRWVQSRGGAICNTAGTVFLDSCSFIDNSAVGPPRNFLARDGCGGAVHNAGALVVVNSAFTGNLAQGGSEAGSGYGGAICNYGSLQVHHGFFSKNSAFGTRGTDGSPGRPVGMDVGGPGDAGRPGGAGAGGAIFNAGNSLLSDSTFTENTAAGGVGGDGGAGADVVMLPPDHIGFGGDGGHGGRGGAALGAICDLTSACAVSNCLLDLNSALAGPGGAGGRRGYATRPGIDGRPGENGDSAGAISTLGALLSDSVLRGNTPPECLGTVTDGGGNSSSDASCGIWRPGHEPQRAPDYRLLYNFGITELLANGRPFGPLLLGPDGNLYGATHGAYLDGHPSYPGSIFAVSTNAAMASYRPVLEPPGPTSYSVSVMIGRTLFGGCGRGGPNDRGLLFSIELDGSQFTVLKDFGGSFGSYPAACLVADADTLYGLTGRSEQEQGTIFCVRTNGADFITLKRFQNPADALEYRLLISGDSLFGTTHSGGSGGEGVIFKLNTDGTDYTILKQFLRNEDGRRPTLWLMSGSVLFGSTYYEADYDGWRGTVFQINSDGSGFQTLYRFEEKSERAQQTTGLVLWNNTFIGATYAGGAYNFGRLFKLGKDGTGFEVLRHFKGPDGATPGCLTTGVQSVFGTTMTGGFFGEGLVFEQTVSSPVLALNPPAQTAEAGSTVEISASIRGPNMGPLQWYDNATNAFSGATGHTLSLQNVQMSDSGNYSFVATNPFGSTTNRAVLNVVPSVERALIPSLEITTANEEPVILEGARDLDFPVAWEHLATIDEPSGRSWLEAPGQSTGSRSFYRLYGPNTSIAPQLSIGLSPAILLPDAPGTTVRVDWINAVGPIENWNILATVTITNTSQLVLDPVAPTAPARNYRLVPLE